MKLTHQVFFLAAYCKKGVAKVNAKYKVKQMYKVKHCIMKVLITITCTEYETISPETRINHALEIKFEII